MRRLYQLPCDSNYDYDASQKAPADAYQILHKIGASDLPLRRNAYKGWIRNGCLQFGWFVHSLTQIFGLQSGSTLFIQYPSSFFIGRLAFGVLHAMRRFRKTRIILLVHDIEDLRSSTFEGAASSKQFWASVNKETDTLIVHNSKMSEWLETKMGIPRGKIIAIGVFDYLVDKANLPGKKEVDKSVVIAGNLSATKAAYVLSLGTLLDVQWELYGPNYAVKESPPNVHYHGSFQPDELPEKMKRGFGLVWDGDSIDTCSGAAGEYLRYNNPHKASLFLACEMPIIIWKEAALADFVRCNNIGVLVTSLREIPEVLKAITPEKYLLMCQNVKRVSVKIRGGGYLRDALQKVL